jgi:hypothetical protein
MRMPPVAAASAASWPCAMVSSISRRKAVANSCLLASKARFFAAAFLFFLAGLGWGVLDGEAEAGLRVLALDRGGGVDLGLGLWGECSSFQSLVISWAQNASTLGRCGEGGIRAAVLEGDLSLDLEGLDGGVVQVFVSWSGSFEELRFC